MASLKADERRQRCEHKNHDLVRSQDYYVVRSFYNELENHFCQGCCRAVESSGMATFEGMEGYIGNNKEILSKYGVKNYYVIKV